MCRNTVLPLYFVRERERERELMSTIEGRTWAESVRELGAEGRY